ncbi:MAG: ABC transporter permease [Lachnospira sp.]|nr:ABC transporter permease [Lachnospira sp.]
MKKFFIVFEYEFMNYLKNKSFVITTILISVIMGAAMFLPNIFDMSEMLGTGDSSDTEQTDDKKDENSEDTGEKDTMLIFDKSGAFVDMSLLESAFSDVKWEKAESADKLKEKVENEEVEAGFIVNSLTSYEYCVHNRNMSDYNTSLFESVLRTMNQMKYCQDNNINYQEIMTAFSPVIEGEVNVLGKDMADNYFYCYFLVIIVFMIIIFYGVMVATSVTQEKSNRSIEVLVTSVDTNSLFFGKVMAGTVAALVQVGIIMVSILGCYQLNRDAWGGALDMLFDIPVEVIVSFAFFGLGGLLFYTFIYGALGALVSKTEDINKASGGVQMIIMVVYFVMLFFLTEVDSIVIKVASFLPISSYSAMFARIAMGNVAIWEIVVSFVILVVSTILVGILGSKIYRMGTLRYGNPIKLSNALKSIKNKD